MDRVNILHITDLHLGSPRGTTPVGCVRDKALTAEFAAEFRYRDCREHFLNRVLDLLQGSSVDIIACTGDLGWMGDANAMRDGTRYIGKLATKLKVKPGNVVISPGNHDLDQEAKEGEELKEFFKSCTDMGFRCAGWKEPLCTTVRGVPIVAFNTCLGGTQHALCGVPSKYWTKATELVSKIEGLLKLPVIAAHPKLSIELQALDIPAIGVTQLDRAFDYLREKNRKFFIVLTHHNPLPTSGVDVRPYSSLLDSGRLLHRLVENGRRALVLHGHAHCDFAMQVQMLESLTDGVGFLTAVGDHGLHDMYGSPSATHIQILIDEDGDFLAGIFCRFANRESEFKRVSSFHIFDTASPSIEDIPNLDALSLHRKYLFGQVAEALGETPDEKLAATLLRLTALRPLSIEGIGHQIEEWMITRDA